MKKAYLILENGAVFCGERFGAEINTVGELVFTTGMCGYIETLTDPSYYGQIVLQTFPLIGNYGIIPDDFEGECHVKGYVVREWCGTPSNFRSEKDLDAYLKEKGVCALCGIDTRRVTELIREYGVMNAVLSDKEKLDSQQMSMLQNYRIKNALSAVSARQTKLYPADGIKRYHVALIDYGAKRNIIRELTRRGCEVTVFPHDTTAEKLLACAPDGIMLSNGPGDPADNPEEIEQLRRLAGRAPMFGICLGHQLLALAMGAETEKLKYGHRGANHPVRELFSQRTYITSQNHGYAVKAASVKNGIVTYVNANDGTCEGIDYPEINAFSIQFHPEAASGPHDTSFLFDRFIRMMKENQHA